MGRGLGSPADCAGCPESTRQPGVTGSTERWDGGTWVPVLLTGRPPGARGWLMGQVQFLLGKYGDFVRVRLFSCQLCRVNKRPGPHARACRPRWPWDPGCLRAGPAERARGDAGGKLLFSSYCAGACGRGPCAARPPGRPRRSGPRPRRRRRGSWEGRAQTLEAGRGCLSRTILTRN